MATATNYYDFFDLSMDASMEDIKNAYFQKFMDFYLDDDETHNQKSCFIKVTQMNKAFLILSNPISRGEYDKTLDFEQMVNNKPKLNKLNDMDKFMVDNPNAFCDWLEEYSCQYVKKAYEYFKQINSSDNKTINELYDSFQEIITQEKKQQNKSLKI